MMEGRSGSHSSWREDPGEGGSGALVRDRHPRESSQGTKEARTVMETIGEHHRGSAGRDRAGVSVRRPVLVHHVVARQGDKGLEVLRIPLQGKGGTLPVFTAGWAARRYLFAEPPGGGWYVRACTPGELVSLLVGLYASVEWVALDHMPGRRGREAANMMPRENFVCYLLCSRSPSLLRPSDSEIIESVPYGRADDR